MKSPRNSCGGCANGESPTIEEYTTAHPHIAEELADLIPAVQAMERLKTQKEDHARSRFLRGPRPLTKLGDYLILGEIGRGGMGIVYEAEQQSLGRKVAVKILPLQSMTEDRRVERFEREARTAARLHHTNIVPIFGVGNQDGFHYYVMQFIRGLGLDRVLRELRGEKQRQTGSSSYDNLGARAREAASGLRRGQFKTKTQSGDRPPSDSGSVSDSAAPSSTDVTLNSSTDLAGAVAHTSASDDDTYWQSVARVGVQVADALSYAHSQGTLHRDIKPANLLLDEFGVVWVADFGLAKAAAEGSLTQSSDVVGTLQYMAPEQFGGIYDARSDIYGLGLTLYEMLTLRPAFDGTNRSGLIHRVTEGRPIAPRKHQERIPADLETIVLKSMSREPEHRYQDADALREDLHRFLEDRPILARRTTPVQHMWRWCRRNRALSSAVVVALLAVLSATALGWFNYVKLSRINHDLAKATKLSQDTLSRSLRGFGDVIAGIVGPDLYQVVIRNDATEATQDGEANTEQIVFTPEVSKRDAEILEGILVVYEEFATENFDGRCCPPTRHGARVPQDGRHSNSSRQPSCRSQGVQPSNRTSRTDRHRRQCRCDCDGAQPTRSGPRPARTARTSPPGPHSGRHPR